MASLKLILHRVAGGAPTHAENGNRPDEDPHGPQNRPEPSQTNPQDNIYKRRAANVVVEPPSDIPVHLQGEAGN